MTKMMYRDAVLSTIMEEMARDPDVVVLGEDVVGGMGTAGGPEAIGGIWSTSTGLYDRFGPGRVIDTPISELGGAGVAAAITILVLWSMLGAANAERDAAREQLRQAQQTVAVLRDRAKTDAEVNALPADKKREELRGWATP